MDRAIGSEPRTVEETCVHDLVSAMARANPTALALASGERLICYAELDRRSDQVANHLRSLGVGPEVLVAVCVERSPEFAIAALGVLKSGGAYLPLDASYPDERLAFMVGDSEARVLITQKGVGQRFPGTAATTVVLDDAAGWSERPSGDVTPNRASSRNLAYVIYTSGSTGTPKGVMIEHRSLLNLVRWHVDTFEVSDSDRASQLTSPAFDAAVWEIWPYLASGASVHFVDESIRADITALRQWFESERITIGFLPTALAEGIVQRDWSPSTALRVLLTGGEALHRYPPRGLPFVVVNNYGPTEATVLVTSMPVSPAEAEAGPPPIGRPIVNSRVHVVDEALRSVPAGSAGELLIGGRAVARGYLNRPELTAERFITDPFSDDPGALVYRTGDLVRQRPNGILEFLGRQDEQVKIHGFRVEPAEVAAVLEAHPDIRASVVVGRETRLGVTQLVAYIVTENHDGPPPARLREHLRRHLPEHMVPSVVVELDTLPLTPNGKVNRSMLPAPEIGMPIVADVPSDASSELVHTLIEMVAELLAVEHVGADDNFFEHGGHSLLAAQLIARVRDRFGVEMSLRSLFENPSVAAMAGEVERLIMEQLDTLSDEDAERLTLSADMITA